MKKLLLQSLSLGIALILCVGALHIAWSWWRRAQDDRRRLDQARGSTVCEGGIALAKSGEQSMVFQHDLAMPHGVRLELRTLSSAPTPPPEDILPQLSAIMGAIQLYDPTGALIWEDDFANFLRHHIDDSTGELVMPLRPCAPLAIRKHPMGRGKLVVVIQQPAAALANQPFVLIGRHALSGVEGHHILLAKSIALALALLALVILLRALSIGSRLRQTWQRRHLLQPDGLDGRPILYLLTSYPRWSETFLRQDLQLLQDEKLPIHPVALFPGDCDRRPDWPEVTLLSDKPAAGADKPAVRRARKHWARLLPDALHAHLSLFTHRQLRKRLIAMCQAKHIGHIHAEFADLAALLAADVAHYLDIGYSVGIHACDIHACKYPRRRLFAPASFVTVCNQAAAQAFRQHCPQYQDRLNIINHGILLDKWPFIPERPASECWQILFVGRLVPKKGLTILLDALAILQQQHCAIHLRIVGAGPLEDDLRQQAKTLNIESLITWTGVLPPEDVRTHIQQAHCLCMPSIVTADGDRDGIPNVVTEAMASGLPVVGSQFGSLGEVLNNDTGWPVETLTPENLAAIITDCAAQKIECTRRSNNARQLIESRFDARKLAGIRAELFRRLNHIRH